MSNFAAIVLTQDYNFTTGEHALYLKGGLKAIKPWHGYIRDCWFQVASFFQSVQTVNGFAANLLVCFSGKKRTQQASSLHDFTEQREDMASDLKYPEWQEPLLEAIVHRRGFLEAETVIRNRLHSLLDGMQGEEERQALIDALTVIRLIR
jgi:hypothetical protein